MITVNHPLLSDTIVFGGLNKGVIFYSTNLINICAELFLFVAKIGQPVGCSTSMASYLLLLPDFGRSSAKSIDYISNLFVRGIISVV